MNADAGEQPEPEAAADPHPVDGEREAGDADRQQHGQLVGLEATAPAPSPASSRDAGRADRTGPRRSRQPRPWAEVSLAAQREGPGPFGPTRHRPDAGARKLSTEPGPLPYPPSRGETGSAHHVGPGGWLPTLRRRPLGRRSPGRDLQRRTPEPSGYDGSAVNRSLTCDNAQIRRSTRRRLQQIRRANFCRVGVSCRDTPTAVSRAWIVPIAVTRQRSAAGRRRCRWRWWPPAAGRAPPRRPAGPAVAAPRATTWTVRSSVAAAGADPGHRRGDLEDVAGPHRRAELHVGVRREQALVAVGADAHLGGDVAEQPERVGAVDEVAGVVGVGVRHVAAVRHGECRRRVGRSCGLPVGLRWRDQRVDEVAAPPRRAWCRGRRSGPRRARRPSSRRTAARRRPAAAACSAG